MVLIDIDRDKVVFWRRIFEREAEEMVRKAVEDRMSEFSFANVMGRDRESQVSFIRFSRE